MKADVKPVTKTEQLLKVIEGLGNDKFGTPIGIRTTALAEASGVAAGSIQVLLMPLVKNGRLCVCKVTVPGSPPQNEYRVGGGKAAPDFKPLNPKKTGIALSGATHRDAGSNHKPAMPTRPDPAATPVFLQQPQPAVGQNTGSSATGMPTATPSLGAPAVAAAKQTPKPETRAKLKKEPVAPKASARDAINLTLDNDGALAFWFDDIQINLTAKQTRTLGHFMGATQGVWNPF